MFRLKPTNLYNGLTIIMSNPSRLDLDNKSLLVGNAGRIINNTLAPHFNRYQTDIRLVSETAPLLPNTLAILALGEPAMRKITGAGTYISEQRGSPLKMIGNGLPVISSFSAQDACEVKNYENQFNPLLQGTDDDSDIDATGKNEDIESKRRHGKTDKANYAFWLRQDVEKVKRIILNKGELPNDFQSYTPNYIVYPSLEEACNRLCSTRGGSFYFDVETDQSLQITCFAFSLGDNDCIIVPVILPDYSPAYKNTARLFRCLAIAIKHNTVVAHNGAGFDFFVLAHKYRIAVGNSVYDTMLAQSRIFPEVEKSLGHCISLPWMYESYHKDEGSFAYGSWEAARKLWLYCGKDVSSLVRLKRAQTEYAKNIKGMPESIAAVNSYIKPYLTTTLTGIRFSEEERVDIMKQNDRKMNQLIRFSEVLVGRSNLEKIRGSGKAPLVASPQQCCKYFHDLLKYPIQGRTATGNASLSGKYFYKLKLKMNNPMIDIIIRYRELAKESGSLKFTPWKQQTTI